MCGLFIEKALAACKKKDKINIIFNGFAHYYNPKTKVVLIYAHLIIYIFYSLCMQIHLISWPITPQKSAIYIMLIIICQSILKYKFGEVKKWQQKSINS
ncbi:MAG: hypothetical protein CMH26_02355 [Micavibrio sp.]|nr:hypothetical protein [Micavibrio sp.]